MRTNIWPQWARFDPEHRHPRAVKRPLPPLETGEEGDDAALFRAAIGDVQPLPIQNRIVHHPAPRYPRLGHTVPPATATDTLSDYCGGELPEEYLANGLSRMTLRKLRRGQLPPGDRLDLHGLDTDSARRLLQAFLRQAVERSLRCVLVIHGKGLNSRGGEAVLRLQTRHWLTQHPHVLAWCEAPAPQGGSGATIALLKAVD